MPQFQMRHNGTQDLTLLNDPKEKVNTINFMSPYLCNKKSLESKFKAFL